jgi:hypothetical protein
VIGQPLPRPIYAVCGFSLFLLSAYLAERQIDGWRLKTGRRPAEKKADKKQLMQELPSQIRRNVRLTQGFGFALMAAGMVLSSL